MTTNNNKSGWDLFSHRSLIDALRGGKEKHRMGRNSELCGLYQIFRSFSDIASSTNVLTREPTRCLWSRFNVIQFLIRRLFDCQCKYLRATRALRKKGEEVLREWRVPRSFWRKRGPTEDEDMARSTNEPPATGWNGFFRRQREIWATKLEKSSTSKTRRWAASDNRIQVWVLKKLVLLISPSSNWTNILQKSLKVKDIAQNDDRCSAKYPFDSLVTWSVWTR